MSERKREKRVKENVVKKRKDDVEKKPKKTRKEDKQKAAGISLSLLADEGAIDPTLSSLFAAKVSKIEGVYASDKS